MVSIYWLGLEGDDVRFDEPHVSTDKPIISFELNEGWELVKGLWLNFKWGYKGLGDNHFYLVKKDKDFPIYYRASTTLFWILHNNCNEESLPPFVNKYIFLVSNQDETFHSEFEEMKKSLLEKLK